MIQELSLERFIAWIQQQCLVRWGARVLGILPLASDGSDRSFFRVELEGGSLIALSNSNQRGENDAYWRIGRHLASRGIPVPELYEYEKQMGWFLLEDLGEVSLQQAALKEKCGHGILELYKPVLEALLCLQLRGKKGFDESWCYQSSRYDESLMMEKESVYFLEAFLQGYMFWKGPREFLMKEFQLLARTTAELAPPAFLMHRDFQSRNVLIDKTGKARIIDFQGARLGPLQYDLASLLLDPYVGLPPETKAIILEQYLDALSDNISFSREDFLGAYPLVELHRNMQILGAFAYLGKLKGKKFFLKWIPAALSNLGQLLEAHPQWPCPLLRDTVLELASSSDGVPRAG